MQHTGIAKSRVDGPAKVTGAAKYAGEYAAPGLTYGYIISSPIARGRITKIDAAKALSLKGVLQVFTHENRPKTAWLNRSYMDEVSVPGAPLRPLYDDKIHYSGQPIALVVAETFELARYAASLVQIEYATESHTTDPGEHEATAKEPAKAREGIETPAKPRGDADRALAAAPLQHGGRYVHPVEHHNAMEPFATTAIFGDDGRLTIYDKTQGAVNCHGYLCSVFGLSKDDVRVINSFVGGGFGSGLRPQYSIFLATMAAIELKRSVRVTLTRQQMFTFGYRPHTIQHISLAAQADGALEAIVHEAIGNTSQYEDYQENDVNWSGVLYKCDNTKFTYRLAHLDLATPIDMRAPGGCTGMFAIESAMDELSYKVGIDPLEMRLRNYTDRDQDKDVPFSSKALRECYRQGAGKFGWAKRSAKPRSMRDGHDLIGYGMATGIWEAMQNKASAKAVLSLDGKLVVSSATADIGTGTYTIMTQLAAEALGLPMSEVTFKLGDSVLPPSPVEGGSWTAGTIGSAVQSACDGVREKALELAQKLPGSPLAQASLHDVIFDRGKIRLKSDQNRSVSIGEAMRADGANFIEHEFASMPNLIKQSKFARFAHSAVFVEVRVDESLGVVRVPRIVNAVAAGRILNPKTARSQMIGGTIWGISMALHEESHLDHKFGRFMNHNLAEYHVPVNADIRDIDVIFVHEDDEVVNSIGVKGIGEIGVVGTAAAVANAVYHATGKRVRELPITLDKLL